MNICTAGHTKHERYLTRTSLGDMWVYNYRRYLGQAGQYCSGQDAVSQSLTLEGAWEQVDTDVILPLLKAGNKDNLVLDFGSHVGWYTLMAAQLGYDVWAYDGDAENIELMKDTLSMHGLAGKVIENYVWLDELSEKLLVNERVIELVKADVEGNERFVIDILDDWLKAGKINNLYLEITPAFNDSYPELVNKLYGYGFKAYMTDGKEFNDTYDFGQINLLFTK